MMSAAPERESMGRNLFHPGNEQSPFQVTVGRSKSKRESVGDNES